MGPPICSEPQTLVGLRWLAKGAVISTMGSKSREVIYGGRVRAAKMNADRARKLAVAAV
jgi:hypothetical protein